jgi:hypothetical protein
LIFSIVFYAESDKSTITEKDAGGNILRYFSDFKHVTLFMDLKSIIYQIVSILAVGLYFVPMLIVLGKKLWPAVPFRLFALYWLVGAFVNLIEFIPLPAFAIERFTVIYNLLDIPFVLTVFYFSTADAAVKKFIKIVAPALLLTGLANCIIRGFTTDALEYVLGGELLIVLGVIIWEIILKLQQIK